MGCISHVYYCYSWGKTKPKWFWLNPQEILWQIALSTSPTLIQKQIFGYFRTFISFIWTSFVDSGPKKTTWICVFGAAEPWILNQDAYSPETSAFILVLIIRMQQQKPQYFTQTSTTSTPSWTPRSWKFCNPQLTTTIKAAQQKTGKKKPKLELVRQEYQMIGSKFT